MKKGRIEHVTRYLKIRVPTTKHILRRGGKAQDKIFGRSQEDKSRQLVGGKKKEGRADMILKMSIVGSGES